MAYFSSGTSAFITQPYCNVFNSQCVQCVNWLTSVPSWEVEGKLAFPFLIFSHNGRYARLLNLDVWGLECMAFYYCSSGNTLGFNWSVLWQQCNAVDGDCMWSANKSTNS